MYLFTQTLTSVTNLLAEEKSFGFNFDIFEANLINLVILGGGIFKFGSKALSQSLVERQRKVVESIQDAEERLQQAIIKLDDSEKRLAQAEQIIKALKEDAVTMAKQIQGGIFSEGTVEIERLTFSAKSQIDNIELRVRKEISDYIVFLALQRVTSQLEGKLSPNVQDQIIKDNTSKLC